MNKKVLSILEIFNKRKALSLIELAAIINTDWDKLSRPINWLLDNKYIQVESGHSFLHGEDITPKTPLEITVQGEIALSQEKESHKRTKFNEIRAWITLGISIAAFIKSFFF